MAKTSWRYCVGCGRRFRGVGYEVAWCSMRCAASAAAGCYDAAGNEWEGSQWCPTCGECTVNGLHRGEGDGSCKAESVGGGDVEGEGGDDDEG